MSAMLCPCGLESPLTSLHVIFLMNSLATMAIMNKSEGTCKVTCLIPDTQQAFDYLAGIL